MFSSEKGFTLLELLVALGVFVVVATVAVGALLIITGSERKVFHVQTNQDNVRFTLETMGREIRIGTDYVSCSPSCFSFTNSRLDNVTYRLGTAVECGGLGCILRQINGNPPAPMTSPDVSVESLLFRLSGQGYGDGFQPRVTITIKAVTPGVDIAESSDIDVQTTVSQLYRN